ncbi:PAS domain-containing sensor histidine kinase [Rufibacter aurantiacus]|uniref:PAS domain-containing sensor histidine kinase n=1 Tax=Rufibacter aurantiacus TaxID=2817374 RepID=UPI001B306C25|nr:PAS domain S-box protein [Rufibacter aurantiacus]
MNASDSIAFYKGFFENSPEPGLLIGADRLVMEMNRAAQFAFGFSDSEMVGKDWLSLVDTSDSRLGSFLLQSSGEDTTTLELTGIRKDGGRFPCRFSIMPVNEGSRKAFLCTISTDKNGSQIPAPTLTNAAETSKGSNGSPSLGSSKLTFGLQDKANLRKLLQIYDNLGEVIYMYEVKNNDTFRFESVNQAFLNVTGLRKDQVVGRYVEEVIPEPSLTLVRSKYAQAIETGHTVKWEEVTPYPTGVKTGLVTITPLYNEQHTCTNLLGTVTDITEIRAAEKDLEVSNERFVYATKATRDAIYDWNIITGDIHWGEGLEKLFGYGTAEPGTGISFWKRHLHPEDSAAVNESLTSFLEDPGQEQWECDYRFCRADGTFAYVTDRAFAIRDNNGKAIRLVGAMQDQTRRREHEAERELLISHLTQRNNELEQFSFITSHNLRAPVSNLVGLTDLLSPESTQDTKTNYILGKIKESAHQLNNIVEDLSDILVVKSNSPAGAENLSLQETLGEAVKAAGDQLTQVNATIETDFSRGDSLFFSREYLRNILLNLLTNAVKFRSPERPLVIKLRTETQGSRLKLNFTDNGMGIDLGRYGSKIFQYQRFQAKAGNKGIGLFMVQEQLKAMGGVISVASEVNVGTTFTILFGNSQPG